jgi:hypothetical protein
MDQRSLFGLSEHLERLSKNGDPLETLKATVDFEYFRGWLVEGWDTATERKAVGRHSTQSRCSRR